LKNDTRRLPADARRAVLNTFLVADDSPSDQLVVKGSATGTTSININNVRGPGLETTAKDILVVNA
jgi:outer membrane autotransporter protein